MIVGCSLHTADRIAMRSLQNTKCMIRLSDSDSKTPKPVYQVLYYLSRLHGISIYKALLLLDKEQLIQEH